MPDAMSVLADFEWARGGTTLPLLALLALVVVGACLAGGVDIDDEQVIDGETKWSDDEFVISSNVTVVAGGVLNVTNATLTFEPTSNGSIGIHVEAGGTLLIIGTVSQATEHTYFVTSRGDTVVRDSELADLHTAPAASGEISEMRGGLVAVEGSLDLRNVTIRNSSIGLTVDESDLVVDGLRVTGGGLAMLLVNSTGSLADVTITDLYIGVFAKGSGLFFDGLLAERLNYTISAEQCDITIQGATSKAYINHMVMENGTTRVLDSTFVGAGDGVMAFLGHLEVAGCTFTDVSTAIELLYAEGIITNVLVDGFYGKGIVLNYVGYGAEDPEFAFDNVTLRDGWDTAVDIEACSDITLVGLVVEDSGEGVHLVNSEVSIVDSRITELVTCPVGCDGVASATGVVLETSSVDLEGVDILGCQGPAISSYFSYINATSCNLSDSWASAVVLVYSVLSMSDCVVTGNAWWGVEALASFLDPEELDGTWDNALADVRMNMTINVEVVDHTGMWLSHAQVTAVSDGTSVGPHTTGFGGSTPTFELPIYEYEFGVGNHSFNPWTFQVEYNGFSNTTEVDLQLGLGQITLVIPVPRADLVVETMGVPRTREPGTEMRLRATVANVGNFTVDSAILTFYYRNEAGFQRAIGETAVGPIAPGESEVGAVEWVPLEEGTFTIVAFVDVDDLVDEEDEDNNRMERELEIREEEGGIPGASAAMAVIATALAALVAIAISRR